MQEIAAELPVQVAVFLGFATFAVIVYFSLIRAGKGLKDKQQEFKRGGKKKPAVIVPFFSDPNSRSAGSKSKPLPPSPPEFKKMMLITKYYDTHDTIVLRFALPHHGKCDGKDRTSLSKANVYEIAGIAPARHVQLRAQIGGELVQRSFSPTSCSVDEAHCGLMDLHIKVYHPSPEKGFPTGGVMSCYLESLAIGSTVDVRGPTGIVEYIGNGAFIAGASASGRRVVSGKHLVFIAGGSGITPIVATLKAILHAKLGGMRVPPNQQKEESRQQKSISSNFESDENTNDSTCNNGTACQTSREYLRGECRHSFYTPSPTCLSEASNEIERITFIYVNHSLEDIMFKDWLLGDDVEHSCIGAFSALAEAGGVVPADEHVAAELPDGFNARPIDVSMNFFITRPSDTDLAEIAAANAHWEKEEVQKYCLSSGGNNPQSSDEQTGTENVSTQNEEGKKLRSAIVTRRYAVGRPTIDSITSCMIDTVESDGTLNVKEKVDSEKRQQLARAQATVSGFLKDGEGSGERCTDTVALLCGPPGLLSGVARPALLSFGIPKEKILLA